MVVVVFFFITLFYILHSQSEDKAWYIVGITLQPVVVYFSMSLTLTLE